MRSGILGSGEFIKATLRKFNKTKGEADKEGRVFWGKQTSVADAVAFQANKGAHSAISSPLTPMDSVDISFEMYTTSQYEFGQYDEVDIAGVSYTVEEVIILKDNVQSITGLRTGKGLYPKVLRLK